MPIFKVCPKCRTNVEKYKPHRCRPIDKRDRTRDINSQEVRSVWTSRKWLRLREYVYSTYGNSGCSRCGSMDTLQLHHIIKVREDITKAYDIDNVCLLCSCCHKYIDDKNNGQLDFKFDKYVYNYTIS